MFSPCPQDGWAVHARFLSPRRGDVTCETNRTLYSFSDFAFCCTLRWDSRMSSPNNYRSFDDELSFDDPFVHSAPLTSGGDDNNSDHSAGGSMFNSKNVANAQPTTTNASCILCNHSNHRLHRSHRQYSSLALPSLIRGMSDLKLMKVDPKTYMIVRDVLKETEWRLPDPGGDTDGLYLYAHHECILAVKGEGTTAAKIRYAIGQRCALCSERGAGFRCASCSLHVHYLCAQYICSGWLVARRNESSDVFLYCPTHKAEQMCYACDRSHTCQSDNNDNVVQCRTCLQYSHFDRNGKQKLHKQPNLALVAYQCQRCCTCLYCDSKDTLNSPLMTCSSCKKVYHVQCVNNVLHQNYDEDTSKFTCRECTVLENNPMDTVNQIIRSILTAYDVKIDERKTQELPSLMLVSQQLALMCADCDQQPRSSKYGIYCKRCSGFHVCQQCGKTYADKDEIGLCVRCERGIHLECSMRKVHEGPLMCAHCIRVEKDMSLRKREFIRRKKLEKNGITEHERGLFVRPLAIDRFHEFFDFEPTKVKGKKRSLNNDDEMDLLSHRDTSADSTSCHIFTHTNHERQKSVISTNQMHETRGLCNQFNVNDYASQMDRHDPEIFFPVDEQHVNFESVNALENQHAETPFALPLMYAHSMITDSNQVVGGGGGSGHPDVRSTASLLGQSESFVFNAKIFIEHEHEGVRSVCPAVVFMATIHPHIKTAFPDVMDRCREIEYLWEQLTTKQKVTYITSAQRNAMELPPPPPPPRMDSSSSSSMTTNANQSRRPLSPSSRRECQIVSSLGASHSRRVRPSSLSTSDVIMPPKRARPIVSQQVVAAATSTTVRRGMEESSDWLATVEQIVNELSMSAEYLVRHSPFTYPPTSDQCVEATIEYVSAGGGRVRRKLKNIPHGALSRLISNSDASIALVSSFNAAQPFNHLTGSDRMSADRGTKTRIIPSYVEINNKKQLMMMENIQRVHTSSQLQQEQIESKSKNQPLLPKQLTNQQQQRTHYHDESSSGGFVVTNTAGAGNGQRTNPSRNVRPTMTSPSAKVAIASRIHEKQAAAAAAAIAQQQQQQLVHQQMLQQQQQQANDVPGAPPYDSGQRLQQMHQHYSDQQQVGASVVVPHPNVKANLVMQYQQQVKQRQMTRTDPHGSHVRTTISHFNSRPNQMIAVAQKVYRQIHQPKNLTSHLHQQQQQQQLTGQQQHQPVGSMVPRLMLGSTEFRTMGHNQASATNVQPQFNSDNHRRLTVVDQQLLADRTGEVMRHHHHHHHQQQQQQQQQPSTQPHYRDGGDNLHNSLSRPIPVTNHVQQSQYMSTDPAGSSFVQNAPEGESHQRTFDGRFPFDDTDQATFNDLFAPTSVLGDDLLGSMGIMARTSHSSVAHDSNFDPSRQLGSDPSTVNQLDSLIANTGSRGRGGNSGVDGVSDMVPRWAPQ
ncbi:hypothetical protein ACOME3_008986 [Neoechinorhynchus agilis]